MGRRVQVAKENEGKRMGREKEGGKEPGTKTKNVRNKLSARIS